MEKEQQDNTKNFSIFQKPNLVTIKNNRFQEYLQISLPGFDLTYTHDQKDYGSKIYDCYGVIGIINLLNNSYLILITDVKLISTFCNREIYKIADTTFVLLKEENDENNTNNPEQETIKKEDEVEIASLTQGLKDIFNNDFYFSNKYDLANSLSSHNQVLISKGTKTINIDYDYIIDGNRNFLANFKMIDKFIIYAERHNTRNFISNCIFGNVEEFKIENKIIKDGKEEIEKMQIIIISRRNLWNYGIYNFRKGLSKKGYNSNQVETETIVVYNNNDIYSHVQISSYFPVYFKEKSNISVNKSFNKYFKTLLDEYNLLLMMGIKSTNDEEENKNFLKLKNLIIKNKTSLENKFKYFNIDSKNNKNVQNILSSCIEKNTNLIDVLGFSHSDRHLKIINDCAQVGVFYLFSLNDEDLNKNQFYLTYKIISEIYGNIRRKAGNRADDSSLLFGDMDLNKKYNDINDPNKLFIEKLQNLFLNRKKFLTQQYYPSTDFNGIKKYQRMIEILFGKTNKKSLNQNCDLLKEEYATQSEIKIFVGSWNAGSTNLSKFPNMNLDNWLIPKNKNIIPDIYFVGFQEVVELNAANVMMMSVEKFKKVLMDWGQKIEQSINTISKYKLLIEMNLVGINFYCYVLEKDFENITNLTNKYVKTGFGGASGNKGSCCINFNYYSTSISVACSHLAAGDTKNKQRLREISEILGQKMNTFQKVENLTICISQPDVENLDNKTNEYVLDDNNDEVVLKKKEEKENTVFKRLESVDLSESFKKSDIWILFGDLNFRIDMDYYEFSGYIKNQEWHKLLDYDQFNKNKKASLDLLEIVEEDEINHPPTYKYIVGSDEYDYNPQKNKEKEVGKQTEKTGTNEEESALKLSGKKRNPSWCDRIFYKKNAYKTKKGEKIIKGIGCYGNVMDKNFQSSDHRPIFNILNAIVFKEDPQKKEVIEKEVYFNVRLNINSKYLKSDSDKEIANN